MNSPPQTSAPALVTLKGERRHALPLSVCAEGLSVLVAGGGGSALSVLEYLSRHAGDARITLVAPTMEEGVRAQARSFPHLRVEEREAVPQDLSGRQLAFFATGDLSHDRHLAGLAEERGILYHVASDPSGGNFRLAGAVILRHPEIEASGGREEVLRSARWMTRARRISQAFMLMVVGYFLFTYLPLREWAGTTSGWYRLLEPNFPWILAAGFVAQLIDGALGMGYGVASATILLSAGVHPAVISGSIHTAEMFASGASGISHYRFGNVNMLLFRRLVVPGVLGAVCGAVLLVYLGDRYSGLVRPLMAAYTLFLGLRFIANALHGTRTVRRFRRYRLLAAVGGFFDSFGGGGWGPIVTSTLINAGRSHRFTVGTVSLTEFFVTLASALTFFQLIGIGHWQTILALTAGGFLAAPLAARLAGRIPRKTAGLLLGLLVIVWSLRIIVRIV